VRFNSVKPLQGAALNARCDPISIPGNTTEDLRDGDGLIGQERAIEALAFGARIERDGYNVFALCDPSSGALESVRQYLRVIAAEGPTPPDWAYVQNYKDPRCPRALALPAGHGRVLRDALGRAVRDLKASLPDIFEGDDYQSRAKAIHGPVEEAIQRITDKAENAGFQLTSNDGQGFAFVPVRGGRKLRKEEIDALPRDARRRLDETAEALEVELNEIIRQLPRWEAESAEKLRRLNYEFMSSAVGRVLDPVRQSFAQQGEVVQFLDEMIADMVEHAQLFIEEGAGGEVPIKAGAWSIQPADPLVRYSINLVVDNGEIKGRPVIVEAHPAYSRLVGRMDQVADLGSIHSDFTMLRAGAMQQANGGFLLIDAEAMLELPAAWEALKTALKTGSVAIDTMREFLGESDTGSITPDAIPLNTKVILFGDWFLHYALGLHDPEFSKLFRVQADFAESMQRTRESEQAFAALLATIQRRQRLKPFDRGAVARLIEEAARHAEDSAKLSLRLDPLIELMAEADFWAAQSGHTAVFARDIEHAIAARIRRLDLTRELSAEVILRDFKRIETSGTRAGQVNGLVIVGTDLVFGLPTRITAQARMGTPIEQGAGQIINIQRHVGKSGPIHSKGVLILGGYLRGRYLPHRPLALSASLAFEQTYSGVDGDSASVAEMCALLSAISGIPLRQGLAVTGAISQRGEVQAIGGVNEKIEGFFDICDARGLARGNGVIIPRANVSDLMLRRDVVEACEKGQFAIYAVDTVDQVMELMTGVKAGRRGWGGKFPAGSVNGRVEARLKEFSAASGASRRLGWL
jgi:lon-related putative ATP-dependent protease